MASCGVVIVNIVREITKMALMWCSDSLEDGHYEGYFQMSFSFALKVFSESYDSEVNTRLQNFWALSSLERKLTFALTKT